MSTAYGNPEKNSQAQIEEMQEVALEHENPKAREVHACAETITREAVSLHLNDTPPEAKGKLWKGIKTAGFGAFWIAVSLGQTVRPGEPFDFRDGDGIPL